jgi:hypothetical protein
MKRTRNVSIKSYMFVDNLISVKMEGFCTGAMCTFQTYEGKPMFGIYLPNAKLSASVMFPKDHSPTELSASITDIQLPLRFSLKFFLSFKE